MRKPDFEKLERAELEDMPKVVCLARTAYIGYVHNGVKKRISTNREGLALILQAIDAALECPVPNENGKPLPNAYNPRGRDAPPSF